LISGGAGVVGGDIVIDAGDGTTTDGVIQIGQSFNGQTIGIGTTGAIDIGTTGAITVGGVGATLGFYGQTPAAQPATPVTLGDVIAALQTLGLVA
jgi:hypothetical protein